MKERLTIRETVKFGAMASGIIIILIIIMHSSIYLHKT